MAVLCTVGFTGLESLLDPVRLGQTRDAINTQLEQANCLRVQFASQYSGGSPGKFILMLEFNSLADLDAGASLLDKAISNYIARENLRDEVNIVEREIWFTS